MRFWPIVVLVLLLSVQPVAAAQPAQVLSAVVRVDGSLVRGTGAVSSATFGSDGYFEVIFNRDVRNCTYVANPGAPDAGGPDDALTLSVSSRSTNPNGVALLMYDTILAADSRSSGFHLIVVC